MKTIKTNPEYADSKELEKFLNGLPDSFDCGGSMLWNGRNKIKAFRLYPADKENGEKRMVVKRFKHPNLIQKIGYTARKHKGMKAYENGLELLARGIDTPTPIAVAELHNNYLIHDAYYICEELSGYTELRKGIERSDWDKDLTKALAYFFAQLHKAGILHHDLNNTNILYRRKDSGYHFVVIDINRITFRNSIKEISAQERIENMTRFTGDIALFEYFAQQYAVASNINAQEEWVEKATAQKKRHDINWDRRKKILHPSRLFG